MALSADPKTLHAKDYRQICQLSREGIYCNIVYNRENPKERDRVGTLAESFFSRMDVYPSTKKSVIRELFGSL